MHDPIFDMTLKQTTSRPLSRYYLGVNRSHGSWISLTKEFPHIILKLGKQEKTE